MEEARKLREGNGSSAADTRGALEAALLPPALRASEPSQKGCSVEGRSDGGCQHFSLPVLGPSQIAIPRFAGGGGRPYAPAPLESPVSVAMGSPERSDPEFPDTQPLPREHTLCSDLQDWNDELQLITALNAEVSTPSTGQLLAAEVRSMHSALLGEDAGASSLAATPQGCCVQVPLEVSAAVRIQAAARGLLARGRSLRALAGEAESLRQLVKGYERHVLPALVIEDVVRRVELRRQLVGAQTQRDALEAALHGREQEALEAVATAARVTADQAALKAQLAASEATSAQLRAELAASAVRAAGRRGGG